MKRCLMIVTLLSMVLFTGCSMRSSEALNSRNFRGCYIVQGMLTVPGAVPAQMNAQGFVMTGEMTVEDCRALQGRPAGGGI